MKAESPIKKQFSMNMLDKREDLEFDGNEEQIQRPKNMVETGPKRELQQRQQFIDQLILELDKKSNALDTVGMECINLRKTIKSQKDQIETLEAKLSTMEFDSKRLVNCYDIDILTTEELRYKYVRLAKKLESCLDWIKKAEPITSQHQQLNEEYYKLRMEHHKLQEAHCQQQDLLLDLQQAGQSLEKYKGVIMKQELIIKEMETRLYGTQVDEPKPRKSRANKAVQAQELKASRPQGQQL